MIVGGISIDVNDLQPSKQEYSNSFTDDGIVIDVNDKHPVNMEREMFVRFGGNWTSESENIFKQQAIPNCILFDGKCNDVIFEHNLKQILPTSWTDDGIVILVNVHLSKHPKLRKVTYDGTSKWSTSSITTSFPLIYWTLDGMLNEHNRCPLL